VLIARAPVRISLAGGGTDLEAYYARTPGAVVSATIDKYFYVFISPAEGDHIQVSSSDYRTFVRQPFDQPPLWDGDLRLPTAVIHHFGIRTGLSVFLASQVPPGTGLGSSSTVAVALIKAMAALSGRHLSRREVAELACEIEIQRLGMPIGKQDQYAAAYGGLNYIEFRPEGVEVEPVQMRAEAEQRLEQRLLLFYTGRWHDSGQILSEQRRNSEEHGGPAVDALHLIRQTAIDMRAALVAGDVGAVGRLLHRSWQAKRRLARGISDAVIDRWYDLALECGAAGGKLTGAGGGGFLLLYCEPDRQGALTAALQAAGLHRMDFRFESGGGMVIMNNLVRPVPVAVHG
jgi:D-glycero-alpha-D-manno-heptose-7-phosphate kinase